MSRKRQLPSPPPSVMVGGGKSDMFPAHIHIAELWVREIEQARDMFQAARSLMVEIHGLDALLPDLDEPEASDIRAWQRRLLSDAAPMFEKARAIRTRLVGNIMYVVDRAEQRARGERSRAEVRIGAGDLTRLYFSQAVVATLAKGLKVTPLHVRQNWPNGTPPSDRHIGRLIRRWKQDMSK